MKKKHLKIRSKIITITGNYYGDYEAIITFLEYGFHNNINLD